MERVNLAYSGYDIDFAIMAFCGESRTLGDIELVVADFHNSSTVNIHNEERYYNGTAKSLPPAFLHGLTRRIISY